MTNNSTSELCYFEASTLARQISKGYLSVREVLEAYLDRIERLNPSVNAICTLVPREVCIAQADALDKRLLNGEKLGPLAGLPMAIKDLALTKGIRTTRGSLAFENFMPKQDALFVSRLKEADAIIIGKTNTPEFGAGSHTFNRIFGRTNNPYNLSRSAGGSSGGAAAALASGMLPLADGSDMGGSLRNPASFCNVVGFRPSIGRIPSFPNLMGWQSRIATEGPMARNVKDCSMLFNVMAGPDIRDPMSLASEDYSESLDIETKGLRVAWSEDLGGLPVAAEVLKTFRSALTHFETLGCEIEESKLNILSAMNTFKVLRGNHFAENSSDFFDEKRSLLKSTYIKNVEYGRGLSGTDISKADRERTLLYHTMNKFFETHDFLLVPSAQVEPFDGDTEWVKEIDGIEQEDYIDWMAICCIITVTGLPAISVPCGFSENGLPIGMQIIGGPGKDWAVLQFANMFEAVSGYGKRRPMLSVEEP